MRKKYTVVIAEDHTILRDGLKSLLNANDEFKVIGEAEDGLNAVRCIKEKTPDVALVDINMPNMGGISVIKEITQTVPETKTMVLTIHSDEEYALDSFLSGANGYCLKTSSLKELLSAIRTVLSGKTYASPEISDKIYEGYSERHKQLKTKSSWDTLTRRELEVLKQVGEGFQNKDIAGNLRISVKTVEKHRENINQKLGLHSASDLTAYAIKKGLVAIKGAGSGFGATPSYAC